MSKQANTQAKKFSYTPTYDLPKIDKIQTEWNLKDLFYSSPNDPKIDKAVSAAEKKYKLFAKKYKDRSYTRNDSTLLKSLQDYERLHDTELDKVFVYLYLCKEKNANDTTAEQALNMLQQRAMSFSNEIVFYTLEIGKLPTARQKKLLKDPIFNPFHHLLHGIFETAKFSLSEAEEKILGLKSLTSNSLWISGTEKILGNTTIVVNKKEESLNGAMMEMLDAPKKRRHQLWDAISTKLQDLGPIAENELTAVILDKKINDELRGYKKPYTSTIQSFDSTEKTLHALTETVRTKGYQLSHRYYKLKKRIYNQKLSYIDRDDYPKRLPELPYETAVTICRDAFYSFNPIYGEIFDEMLTGGHIDVFPKKGKGGGAFCISTINCPTLLMLNHSSDFGSLRTLAHEMGHGIHAYRSKIQPILYQDHSTLTAETASTFFESVVAEKLIQQLTSQQKEIYLNTSISEKIGVIIMCIARYEAELEIHETIRTQGAMTWQDMSSVLAKHFKAYCGSSINITDTDGLSVIAKTHYRRNFYQYSYSLGAIASSIMFENCIRDEKYKDKVDLFLCAGEKDSVENIFKEIGINVSNKRILEQGLTLLEKEIETLEKLVN